ncbi:MAG: YjbQ family protein [Desulfarculus sp.]|jgi:secondary thiamine-phosphate synthase enzyme|nr:MAG: YjbQ family protein [Desulfarculus sp.]
MTIYNQTVQLQGSARTDIHDLTPALAQAVAQSGVQAGSVLVFTPGSTAAVTTIEYESGVLKDLERLLERLAPARGDYEHNARWGDGNGYSHLRAALLGPSLTVPVAQGRPLLGAWQQVVVLDFDNRARGRQVHIQVQGE